MYLLAELMLVVGGSFIAVVSTIVLGQIASNAREGRLYGLIENTVAINLAQESLDGKKKQVS